ncbi:fatty acid amide hydrolase-like isoform X2 [Hibiscus syriacus]|uniref:Fatty acid amide hydrolase-like isoform X2 n=1 Tax=Hibiscus syriacus TaxID=106335 RepID=A0A6A2Y4Q0_HIBSY|nr:fatty acid amide hydrolase-like isoform X2 [Hibiscus syriacus]
MGLSGAAGMVYKPVEEIDLGPASNEFYLKANVKAPRMAGFLVKIFAWFLETRIIGTLLLYILKRNNLIHKLVSNATLEESPMFVPLHPFVDLKEQQVEQIDSDASPSERVQQAINCLPLISKKSPDDLKPKSFRRWTIADYSRAYSSGEITPLRVAEQFINAVRESSTGALSMSFFINYDAEDILKQASESTLRYKRGDQKSALDGVPIAIKDEIDCSPYPTTGGTKWLHKLGQVGINPHYGTTRNPYDPNKIAGGSSSGSAAVVSAGLCPVALGVDGGGSVRMPASLCGVVGLKPTFGRIPHLGVLPLNWTVGMVGILAGTLEDALVVYAAISGQLQSCEPTTLPPKLHVPLLNSANPISDIKFARYGEWFNDCSDEIRICCSNALHLLREHYKWETVEVTIPEIEAMRLAHYLTIGSECTASLSSYLEKLDFSKLGWDARVALRVYGAFDSNEYIKAQKIRNRQMEIHKNIFAKADVIVAPTTGVTAYTIFDDALKTGELDYINGGMSLDRISTALVRYQIAGNFLGLPAVTVPVGYDKEGLPIGLQFIGKPWSEPTLMHIAFSMQALCISQYRKPEVFYNLLNKN